MTPRQAANIKHLRELRTSGVDLIEKAHNAQLSARAVIKAKCLDCCNFDRKSVDLCTSELCPLWAYRPRYGDNKGLVLKRRKAPPTKTTPPVPEWND